MNPPVAQNDLPVSVQKVLALARAELNPAGIVLYGSRARHDASPTSDFDFAIIGVEDEQAWTRFCNSVRYDAPTLFQIDLVRYEEAPANLRSNIDREGRPIHEPSST